MINLLGALVEEQNNMQDQMSNERREMGTLRKYQKEIVEIKTTVTKMKNVFVGLMNRMDNRGTNQ